MKNKQPIIDIIQRSHDTKSFRFTRKDDFDYKPGQYVIVTLDVDGKSVSKPFTLSSSPSEKEHIEFTKKFTGHDYSNVMDAMVIGDEMIISKPYGQFTFEGEYDKIALISGGIGITPMISICKYCTDMQLSTDIKLICSNKTEDDIIFTDELEEMMQQNPNLYAFDTLTRASDEWTGCSGRICDTLIQKEIPDYAERVFYVCGPPPMMDSMVEMLKIMNIADEMIKQESLLGY
ncbi:FAD-binding oxidoreductase [Methanolobus sp. ZRKC3]|uniref:ferredoxin--NADP reductase n=1 Tax=Methanolobus sp. ZRKC3 TaxID=3125786 RepID=UPI0032500664